MHLRKAASREDRPCPIPRLSDRLLEQVDPARDSVLVVGPYHRAGEPHLTIAAMQSPGVEGGLLRSGTTRRTGFVTLVDVAPTILDLVGVDRPESMEGRPFERGAAGGTAGDRREMLIEFVVRPPASASTSNQAPLRHARSMVPATSSAAIASSAPQGVADPDRIALKNAACSLASDSPRLERNGTSTYPDCCSACPRVDSKETDARRVRLTSCRMRSATTNRS